MSTASGFFGSYGPRSAAFTKEPPLKGSFPFDLEKTCKLQMIDYMLCMNRQANHNEKCRALAAEYFRCRMDVGLMAPESFENLGYGDIYALSEGERAKLVAREKSYAEEALKSRKQQQ